MCTRRAANAAKTRNQLKFAGVPKVTKRSQPLVGRSSPYYGNEDMWRRYCCLTNIFPIVDICLRCEDMDPQSCAMVPRWRFLAIFWVLHLQRATYSTFQTCILNSHQGHSVEVWQTSNLRPLRLGEEKKIDRRQKPQHENIIACPIPQGDHNECIIKPCILLITLDSQTNIEAVKTLDTDYMQYRL